MNAIDRLPKALGLFALAWGAMTLAACSDTSEPRSGASATQSSSSTPAPAPDPSTPPAYGTQRQPPKPDSTQTAKASDDALKPMTKEEETNTMPRPGQANDHSTLAPPKDTRS